MISQQQQKWMNAKLSVDRCLEKVLFVDEIMHYVNDKGELPANAEGLRTLIEAIKEDLKFAVANLHDDYDVGDKPKAA